MSDETTEEKPKLPCPLRDDPNFKYVPAAATDVQKTWMLLTDWKPKQ